MKILFIVPYPTLGPSNRFRVEQYLPYLKKEGHTCFLRPFYNNALYNVLYKKGYYLKKIFTIFLLTFRRITDIFIANHCDIIFIHREVFPLGGVIFEHFFKMTGKKIIYDFDDSLFLPDTSGANRFINVFKVPGKIKRIIQMSDAVIAGNSFLRDYALNYSTKVYILPTPIDTEKYIPFTNKPYNKRIVIGWIGSSTTLKYLKLLENVFSEVSRQYSNVVFLVVGKDFKGYEHLNIEFKEWSLDSELSSLQSFDIGIMPLTDDYWSRGKCAFKAIQYMSVGIPVVASDVGMNKEVIKNGINGFLVRNDKEWIDKLKLLIENANLRKEMGIASRKIVEEKYSLKVNAPRLLGIIEKVYTQNNT